MKALQARLGTTVRRLRTAAGFSQEAFAEEAGVGGKVNPTLSTLEKLADALKMTVG